MFHWICPECGREIPPAVKECQACDPTVALAPDLAKPVPSADSVRAEVVPIAAVEKEETVARSVEPVTPVQNTPVQNTPAQSTAVESRKDGAPDLTAGPEPLPDPLLGLAEQIRAAQVQQTLQTHPAPAPTRSEAAPVAVNSAAVAQSQVVQSQVVQGEVAETEAAPPVPTSVTETEKTEPQKFDPAPGDAAPAPVAEDSRTEPQTEPQKADPAPETVPFAETPSLAELASAVGLRDTSVIGDLAAAPAADAASVTGPVTGPVTARVALPLALMPGAQPVALLAPPEPAPVVAPEPVEQAPEPLPVAFAEPEPAQIPISLPLLVALTSEEPKAPPLTEAAQAPVVEQAPDSAAVQAVPVPAETLLVPPAVVIPPVEEAKASVAPIPEPLANPLSNTAPVLAPVPARVIMQAVEPSVEHPPSGSWLNLAPLQNYTAATSRSIQPAAPPTKIAAHDSGPRITLPGPTLPPELVSLRQAGVATVLGDAAKSKKAGGVPGWMVSFLVMMGLLISGVAVVFYFSPLSRSSAEAKPAPADVEVPTAAPASHSLAETIEVTGFRIVVDPSKKAEIHYLVVNHSATELSDVTVFVTLRAANAKQGQPPISRFSFRAPSLGAFEAKEMTSSIEKLPRSLTLPEWQDLHAEVQIAP